MANIAISSDPYKSKYSVNLTDGPEARHPRIWAQKGFRSPVKAMAYVQELGTQGNTAFAESFNELDKICQRWQEANNA